jgi:hypothetical protein
MIPTARAMDLRDGKQLPDNEEELQSMVAYFLRSSAARIEQGLAQRKPMTLLEVRAAEEATAKNIIEYVRQYDVLAERFK